MGEYERENYKTKQPAVGQSAAGNLYRENVS